MRNVTAAVFWSILTGCAVALAQDVSRPAELVIQIEADRKLPRAVARHVAHEDKQFLKDSGERTVIVKVHDDKLLATALASPAVKSIEIARPLVPDIVPNIATLNANSRRSHGVDAFVGTFGFSGAKSRVAVFEIGAVRASHVEFRRDPKDHRTSRVVVNTIRSPDEHATHVAATVGAFGHRVEARGMAPDAALGSEDAHSDLNRLSEIASMIDVSTHSYGRMCGWDLTAGRTWRGDKTISSAEDARFGKYATSEQLLDTILNTHDHLIAVVAAGNDRDDDALGPQPVAHLDYAVVNGRVELVAATDEHPVDGQENGLDTLSGMAVAKNAITVGATSDSGPRGGFAVVPFSSFGPTDDGRIKPDLVANGFKVFSASSSADIAYVDMNGTSQAAPTVAGIAALLVEQYKSRRSADVWSSDIKAVLIHTADDAGEPGPDPQFGWGSVDAFEAGVVIDGAASSPYLMDRYLLHSNEIRELVFESTGDPIRVTMVWTDPAGKPHQTRVVDDRTPVLVNDLDLLLIDPAGEQIYPYALEVNGKPRQRSVSNRADNVEVIDAPARAGTWVLRVTAPRLRDDAPQRVSIVTNGFRKEIAPGTVVSETKADPLSN